MDNFVVCFIDDGGYGDGVSGYWTGKEYQFEGGKYAAETKDTWEAKFYTTEKRAESALKRCLKRYENVTNGTVEKVTVNISCR